MRLPPTPTSSGDSRPVVSPNGNSLAFLRAGSAGFFYDIWILPLANGKPSEDAWRLINANDHCGPSEMTWTPDGRELLFSSVRSGRRSLWRISVSPGAVAQRIPGTDDAYGSTLMLIDNFR